MKVENAFEFNVGDKLTFNQPHQESVVLERHLGGFSSVYVVENIHTKEIFALKTPRIDCFDKKYYNSFIYESQLWLGLPNHDSIVMAYRILTYNEKPFLQVQYVPPFKGLPATLTNFLLHFSIEEESIGIIFAQLVYALQYVDNKEPGFVHGDLKPSNLYISIYPTSKDEGFYIRIADFGLSKMKKYGNNPIFGGDYGYVSPEKMIGEDNGQRSDIYSLGCVLFEMITKEKFQRFDPISKKLIYSREKLHNISNAYTHVPLYVIEILKNCLEFDSKKRIGSYNELWDYCNSLLDKKGIKFTTGIRETKDVAKERNWPIEFSAEMPLHGYLILKRGFNEEGAIEIINLLANATRMRGLKKFQENKELLSLVLKRIPDFPPALVGIAYGELILNNLANSIEQYQKAIDLFLSDEELLDSDKNTFGGACVSIAQAISMLKNGYPSLFLGLQVYYLNFKNLDLLQYGMRCALKGLEIFPNSSRALLSLGLVFSAMGEYSRAISTFESALNIDPNNEAIKKNLMALNDFLKTRNNNK